MTSAPDIFHHLMDALTIVILIPKIGNLKVHIGFLKMISPLLSNTLKIIFNTKPSYFYILGLISSPYVIHIRGYLCLISVTCTVFF